MILANWRGFSGGTRDMYDEVLKFGAKIVDELTKYDMPSERHRRNLPSRPEDRRRHHGDAIANARVS